MEKRVLIAIFLSFLVLYFYQAFFVPPVPEKKAAAGAGTAGSQEESAAPAAPAGTTEPVAVAAVAAEAAAPVVGEAAPREIVVEGNLYRVVLSNRGARVRSWQLKNYRDDRDQPFEMVPQGLAERFSEPLAFRLDDASVTARVNEALFRTSVPAASVRVADRPVTVSFEYQDAAGLFARKALTFEPDSYVAEVEWEVRTGNERLQPEVVWGPAVGPVAVAVSSYHQNPEGILYRAGKVERWSPKNLAKTPTQEAEFKFVGVDEHYFAVLALPGVNARANFEPFEVPVPGSGKTAAFVSWGIRIARAQNSLRFFVGPKDFDILRAVDPDLVRIINYGIFSWLAVPLLRALKGINAYIGNYGWSIIILTVLINLVMFPLRHKSVVSMRRMQALQPQVKAIQERYGKLKATDPARQKMNVELMNLYREKGVNPASGCLPMALTMPVLFAFYSLLSQAIEIRHEPFGLWIRDLSAHDPYYVTPIIMGATMLWQQRITPTGGDPAQQRMMMFMPLIFLVMFLWAPSGLVIYWLFSNLLAIGQQYATNRMVGPVAAPRPPAERQLKKAGAGRTNAAAKGSE